jgi:hypothetical protein
VAVPAGMRTATWVFACLVSTALAFGCSAGSKSTQGEDDSSGVLGAGAAGANSSTGSSGLGGAFTTSGTGGSSGEDCRAVDFLFMIDGSPSMIDEQQRLIDAVPKWFSTLQKELPKAAANYRAMVVDLDDRWGAINCKGCTTGCAYQDGPLSVNIPDYPCSYQPSACDQQLGGGVVFPAGDQASNVSCEFPEGRRWLQASDEAVGDRFSCAAKVGASGSGDEQVAKVLRSAVSPAMVQAGGCNEGFLRSDAILVVVLVTDEDEGDFVDDQLFVEVYGPALKQELIQAKGGDASGVVMVSLINDYGFPAAVCQQSSPLSLDGAKNLREFTMGFKRHFLGSVCSTDYDAVLSQAVSEVTQACADFEPPK